jgi:hypothetical protein
MPRAYAPSSLASVASQRLVTYKHIQKCPLIDDKDSANNAQRTKKTQLTSDVTGTSRSTASTKAGGDN